MVLNSGTSGSFFIALSLVLLTVNLSEIKPYRNNFKIAAFAVILAGSVTAFTLATVDQFNHTYDAEEEIKSEIQRVYGGSVLNEEVSKIIESVSDADESAGILIRDNITVVVGDELIGANLVYVDGEYRFYANEGELQEQSVELPCL